LLQQQQQQQKVDSGARVTVAPCLGTGPHGWSLFGGVANWRKFRLKTQKVPNKNKTKQNKKNLENLFGYVS